MKYSLFSIDKKPIHIHFHNVTFVTPISQISLQTTFYSCQSNQQKSSKKVSQSQTWRFYILFNSQDHTEAGPQHCHLWKSNPHKGDCL